MRDAKEDKHDSNLGTITAHHSRLLRDTVDCARRVLLSCYSQYRVRIDEKRRVSPDQTIIGHETIGT